MRHLLQVSTVFTGLAKKPNIDRPDEGEGWALLQCEVLGASPEPKVEWKDSDGNIISAKEPQGRKTKDCYNITLNTTVTKTGHYRCVATQEVIKHQIHAETYVHLNGEWNFNHMWLFISMCQTSDELATCPG